MIPPPPATPAQLGPPLALTDAELNQLAEIAPAAVTIAQAYAVRYGSPTLVALLNATQREVIGG